MATTYAQYQEKTSSEKNGLATIDGARKLVGWVLDSGSVYRVDDFNESVVVSVENNGVSLTAVGSVGAVVSGTYYHDRTNKKLYLELSDSSDPTDITLNFVALVSRFFFAEVPTIAPWDLSTGYNVEWVPLLAPVSNFGVELDNTNQIGKAIEGKGSVAMTNDQAFWRGKYDKVVFENQKSFIYSWSRELPITEAKLLFRGRIQDRSWSNTAVTFTLKDFLNELRGEVPLNNMEDVAGALIPDGLKLAKQRRIYGDVNGFRPTNIDQVLDGVPGTGTVTAVNGSATITGSGTLFLNELNPGDQLLIDGFLNEEGDEETVTVETISSDTSLTLGGDFEGPGLSGATFKIIPERDKPTTNRNHFVSGDTLKESSTTVVTAPNELQFTVADASDFRTGDRITVNGETRTIARLSLNTIRLSNVLTAAPSPSDVVTRTPIYNVKINANVLQLTRDYTIPASLDRIILDEDAEFNVAPDLALPGTSSFSAGSRTVTGTGTDYLRDVQAGDFIRARGETYVRVLQVSSETSLSLVSVPGYTVAGASSQLRKPNYYTEGEDVLTCSVIGTTGDKTKTGTFLSRGPEIVQDILEEAGLTDDLDSASFTTSNDISEHRCGLAIPSTYNQTTAPSVRDVIDSINESILGALIQNNNFQLEYNVLRPDKDVEVALILDETDAFKFSVRSDSKRLVRNVQVGYNALEYDPLTLGSSQSTSVFTSDLVQYLVKKSDTKEINTVLVDEASGRAFAGRYAFLLELASSVINIETALQTSQLSVTDKVSFSHPEMYERLGSTDRRRITSVASALKSSSSVRLKLDDLANAFTRVAIITENTANDFTTATDTEKAYNGYITDSEGLVNNTDVSTLGINVIW